MIDPHGTSASTILKRTLAKEGPRALFKGAVISCIGQAPSNFVVFGTFGSSQRALDYFGAARFVGVPERHASLAHTVLAGSFAGFTQSLVLAPIEHVKVQQQLSGSGSELSFRGSPRTEGMFASAKAIINKGGVRLLMRGWAATALRNTPALGLYFGAYDVFKQSLHDRWPATAPGRETPPWIALAAGGVAGAMSWMISVPADVVKSVIQGSCLSVPYRETSVRAVARRLYATGGIGAFYRGLLPCILRL
jgi:solute carrier family 25 (mitochondrial carnitine/acylcarnitine transporter), member 20/29